MASLSQPVWLWRLIVTCVAWYLRHTPFAIARWRLVDMFLPRLRSIGHTMGQRLIRTRLGFKMRLDLGEWICQHIYMTGAFEPATAQLISSLLHEGDTVIDIGANIGYFTLLASKKVGLSGKVHAFEPVRSTSAELRENLARNGAANVGVHESALSNTNGAATIYEGPQRNKGNSSMRPIADASAVRTVPVASFDSLDVSKGPTHLIKIDVEGAEQLVIEGMKECIRKNRPHLIIEVTDAFLQSFGHSARSLARELKALRYSMYEITGSGLAPLPADIFAWPPQFNAYCSADDSGSV